MIGRLLGRKIYYYIPTCPDCGSRRTGKYVKEPSSAETAQYIMRQSLRHGADYLLPEVPLPTVIAKNAAMSGITTW